MKHINLFLFLMLAILFQACSASVSKEIRIGFVIHSALGSRWSMDVKYIKEHAAEVGVTVMLKDAQGDENVQLKQAHELLEEGVDVLIVVAANQNTAAGIVRDAHDYNVPVIGYDRLIRNCDLDYLVSFEYEKVGELMIEYVDRNAKNGKCILFWGDASDANAVFVKNGIENALTSLAPDHKLEVVYKTFIENWTYDNAKHQMNQILDFYPEKIDAVIACNDPLGIGAYDALLEHGYHPNQVVITGQDATIDYVHSMLNGGLTMSIAKPIKELAYGVVDLVVDLVKYHDVKQFDKVVNNGRKDVPAKLFSPQIVDQSNFDEVLIQSGVYTHDEVYGNQ